MGKGYNYRADVCIVLKDNVVCKTLCFGDTFAEAKRRGRRAISRISKLYRDSEILAIESRVIDCRWSSGMCSSIIYGHANPDWFEERASEC